ncbi:lysosomal pro-x carboxypeptidase-like [Plakobranchus ocellatus]|uniref:Lysosomal pro-x carboxypeptidase-like n=1 Tax=Plakobranchus ocellatus TaxID=259542 RepID=A0AAV3YGQ1_9GAST|nr:lysosomal pro-x carboxypeptidase-like [Plakobranchus ocellatus]
MITLCTELSGLPVPSFKFRRQIVTVYCGSDQTTEVFDYLANKINANMKGFLQKGADTLIGCRSILSFCIAIGILGLYLESVGASRMVIPKQPRPLALQSELFRKGRRTPSGYNFKTLYFDQKVDHFGFLQDKTFKNRYLVADQFWNRDGGPIFFYTGNEGDIELFCNNTGLMWDIAPQFKALLVFAEHRFYGKSMPFGPESFKNKTYLNYLTSEQALADFAELITYIKSTIPGAANSPVIAFGGSYGGMLAAWFRIKYTNVVLGSLAASAPIWQFTGITPCNAFYDVASATWARASNTCVSNAYNAYSTMEEIGTSAAGLKFISDTFVLCDPLKSAADIEEFKAFLANLYVNYAMVDYPYPTSFLADLPGWPIKEACKSLLKPLSGKPLLQALSKVTGLYFNYTGNAKCIDWKESGSTPTLGYQGWDYQVGSDDKNKY